jgi:hypothetical protein
MAAHMRGTGELVFGRYIEREAKALAWYQQHRSEQLRHVVVVSHFQHELTSHVHAIRPTTLGTRRLFHAIVCAAGPKRFS